MLKLEQVKQNETENDLATFTFMDKLLKLWSAARQEMRCKMLEKWGLILPFKNSSEIVNGKFVCKLEVDEECLRVFLDPTNVDNIHPKEFWHLEKISDVPLEYIKCGGKCVDD